MTALDARPVRVVTDTERRARLGVRHALVERVSGPLASASTLVCLHATEAASVYLSAYARSGASREEIDAALYTERSIVKQLAMRRTLFAFPRDLVPAVLGSAAARVAVQQAGLLARNAVDSGLTRNGDAWVRRVCSQVLGRLRAGPATTAQLRQELPVLRHRLRAPEHAGATSTPVASRVVTVLAATGAIVRGGNDGPWTQSRPIWTTAESWLGQKEPPLTERAGYAELVSRWLWAFGPGTEADLTWWLGATKTAVRRALTDVAAETVRLEDGSTAWLRPDDLDEVRPASPWAALLPALDPTTMGWRGRDFYVAPETAANVYDSAGNGRTTAWWDGRIVGSWVQRSDGNVEILPTARLSSDATTALAHKGAELTSWLNGARLRSILQRPVSVPRGGVESAL